MSRWEDTLMSKLIYNYATKTDLKNISHIDVSSLALKLNLAG